MKTIAPSWRWGALAAVAWAMLAGAVGWQVGWLTVPVAWALLAVAWVAFVGGGVAGGRWVWSRRATLIAVGAAVVVRLGLLPFGPAFDDDWHRYAWDGYQLATTRNPYGKAPLDFFGDPAVPEALQARLDGINHPEYPTIYGPMLQAMFGLAHGLAPGAFWPLKLVFLFVEVGCWWALLGRWPGRALVAWAWCPLLLWEGGLSGHPDSAGAALAAVAATWAWQGRGRLGAALLAVAVAAKPLALVVAPSWARRQWGWAAAVGTVVWWALYAPFFAQGSWAEWPVLLEFGHGWHFNGLLPPLLVWAGLPSDWAGRLAGLTLMALALGRWWWGQRHGEPAAIVIRDWLGLFVVCTPVVNPWYLLWLVPWVALAPCRWGWVACGAVSLSLWHGLTVPESGLAPYEQPLWTRFAWGGALVLAWLWDWRWPRPPPTDLPGTVAGDRDSP